MSTTAAPPTITPDEFYRMGDEGRGLELVDGELKGMNMSAESSRIGGRVYRQLENYSEAQHPGWAFPPETGFRCFPDDPGRVRKPDASFVALARMTREEYEGEGFIEVVPDLVAEVISPNDTAGDVDAKIRMWLAAGVKLLWEVYPKTRTVRAHRPGEPITPLRAADTLTADGVLPGFACPVADLFRLPGEPAAGA